MRIEFEKKKWSRTKEIVIKRMRIELERLKKSQVVKLKIICNMIDYL
jgi:hypothetical protein